MKPQFANFQEFLNMDGYAPYVFSAFGLSIAVIIGLVILGANASKNANARLLALEELRKQDGKK